MANCNSCTMKRDSGGNAIADCTACEKGVANLKDLGGGKHRCTDCLNGFTPNIVNGKQNGCKCDGNQKYAVTKAAEAKCKTCKEIIPQCQQCTESTSPPNWTYKVQVSDEVVLDTN